MTPMDEPKSSRNQTSRQKKRVVVACHSWYDDLVGGAFRLASEFAIHLAEQGHEVFYVCSQPTDDSDLPERESCDGVSVLRYPLPKRRSAGITRMLTHLRETRSLVHSLHNQSPVDAISGHSPLQGLGAAQAVRRWRISTKKRQVPFVNYTVHSPFDDELLSNVGEQKPKLGQRFAATVARRIDLKNVKLADRVQTDSRYTLNRFIEKFGSDVCSNGVVAPGWVDTHRFEPWEDRRNLRRQLGKHWDTDVPLFFTLRRLQNRMGLDTLVDACAVLRDHGRGYRTLIGGGGPLKDSLQKQIDRLELNDHVFLLGRLDESILARAYAAADCFVLPTRALECFGLIVLEAFSCNTPVIGSTAAAIPELVAQQGEGWSFKPGFTSELSQRMLDFVDGTLVPERDLRELASAYDRAVVLKHWESLLLGNRGRTVPAQASTGESNAVGR